MRTYMPVYAEALELKKYLSERNLLYVHFHDQCGMQYFNFDEPDEESRRAAAEFWRARGLDVSFSEDKLRFIVVDPMAEEPEV